MQFGLRKVRRGPSLGSWFVSGGRLYLLDAVDYIYNKVKILTQRSTPLLPRSSHESVALAQESPNSTLLGCRNWRPLWVGNLLLAVLKKNVLEK
jgi:hypothetical protein